MIANETTVIQLASVENGARYFRFLTWNLIWKNKYSCKDGKKTVNQRTKRNPSPNWWEWSVAKWWPWIVGHRFHFRSNDQRSILYFPLWTQCKCSKFQADKSEWRSLWHAYKKINLKFQIISHETKNQYTLDNQNHYTIYGANGWIHFGPSSNAFLAIFG